MKIMTLIVFLNFVLKTEHDVYQITQSILESYDWFKAETNRDVLD
jgi:hypothetical protein